MIPTVLKPWFASGVKEIIMIDNITTNIVIGFP